MIHIFLLEFGELADVLSEFIGITILENILCTMHLCPALNQPTGEPNVLSWIKMIDPTSRHLGHSLTSPTYGNVIAIKVGGRRVWA